MKARALLLALAVSIVAAAPAGAANPSSGEVTTSKPSVTWTGTIDEPFGIYDFASWYVGYMGETCEQPHCDVFDLRVGPGAESLTVKAAREATGDGTDNIQFEVEDPDGEVDFVDFDDEEVRPERERTYPAKPGDWVIRVTGIGSFDYTASATLGAPAPPSGGGGEQAAPPPSGGQAAQQAPAPSGGDASAAPSPTLAVRAPSRRARSARRLRKGRSLAVGVTASGPLRDVTAVLVPARRQTRVLGSGRIASLNGAGSVRVKLARSLRKGRYLILVGGIDEQGRRVTARRAVTVTR